MDKGAAKSTIVSSTHHCSYLMPIMSISCDVNLTWKYLQLSYDHLIAIIASRKFQYHPTLLYKSIFLLALLSDAII